MKQLFILLFAICFLAQSHVIGQSVVVISPNLSSTINPISKKLLGLSYDARSSGTIASGQNTIPIGYHDPVTAQVYPGILPFWDRVHFDGVRYPGNMEIYNWNWSYTIGPVANRTAQPTGPNGSNSQTLAFGFDEFMEMVMDKGLAPSDVQVMVNLYASNGQPDPAILAADWVEYCNAPNDGSNPRGGTDWAALRSLYGHEDPYGIRIWNIGNEPWTPNELGGTGGANYISLATPIIDSMMVADPTIQITVPTVIITSGSSNWQNTLQADQGFMNRIYGFSPHSFYDEDVSASNPSVANSLLGLGIFSNTTSKAVIMGDNASFAPSNDPDKAMRWEGALATADYLIGLSQLPHVELANFWIYGNTSAVWHPIRRNNDGSYTLMAAAQLYDTFHQFFLDQSIDADATDLNTGQMVSGVRSSGFSSNDQSQASIIVVNTDLNIDHELVAPSVNGLSLLNAYQIAAPTLTSDTSETTSVLPLPNGHYSLPHAGVLILEYGLTVGINAEKSETKPFLFPNPTDGRMRLSAFEPSSTLTILDGLGRVVRFEQIVGTEIDIQSLRAGVYTAVLDGPDGSSFRQRIVKN